MLYYLFKDLNFGIKNISVLMVFEEEKVVHFSLSVSLNFKNEALKILDEYISETAKAYSVDQKSILRWKGEHSSVKKEFLYTNVNSRFKRNIRPVKAKNPLLEDS